MSLLDWDEAGSGFDTSHTVLYLVGGVPLNEYLDAEIRLGFGLGSDAVFTLNGGEVKIERLTTIGLRAGLPIGDVFRPYLTLGFASVDLGVSVTSGSFQLTASDSENDIFYGIGAGWRFGQGHELNAEFSNYYEKGGVEISGFR